MKFPEHQVMQASKTSAEATVLEKVNLCDWTQLDLKGLRPLPPTPADSRIFGFFDFSENVDLGNFPVGFRVWEDVFGSYMAI